METTEQENIDNAVAKERARCLDNELKFLKYANEILDSEIIKERIRKISGEGK